jgi:hypothetical protein
MSARSGFHDLPSHLLPDPERRPEGWYARVTGCYTRYGDPFVQYELGDITGNVPVYQSYDEALLASTKLMGAIRRKRD